MKVGLASDVHLEFGSLSIKNPGDVDVLILSGDICTAKAFLPKDMHGIVVDKKSESYHEFFREVSEEFAHVVYVVGNHEHYQGDFKTTIPHIKEQLKAYSNVHLLEKETYVVDDITFVCGTLWTDMNKGDPLTLEGIARKMNDFRIIANSNRMVSYKDVTYVENPDGSGNLLRDENGKHIIKNVKFKERVSSFSPQDAYDDHQECLAFIKEVVESNTSEKIVVVGHHTPSFASCHHDYRNERIMNGGYHSDLSEFILDNPQIKLWTHGHTHEDFDYMIGSTRIVCNPRGYINYESRADRWALKVMEI